MYRIMRSSPNHNMVAFQAALEKSFRQTWLDKLLGKNKCPKLDDYANWETEEITTVDTEEEAKHYVWMGEPWMNQTGGKIYYEKIT